jgi:hypothetical protein
MEKNLFLAGDAAKTGQAGRVDGGSSVSDSRYAVSEWVNPSIHGTNDDRP